MTCEAYYTTHAEPAPGSDRCGNHEIEAGTARAVSLLGASTTLFGILNLFVTGWTMKKFGIKAALLISVFWPAVRLAIQNIGVMVGGGKGIIIVQSSQIITILGGPSGYLLALNSYVTEIIEPGERTGSLGKLQGCSFLGTASAYLAGGLISDAFGIIWPFRVTLGLFLTSCLYVFLFLPWLRPHKDMSTQATTGIAKFFGPLKLFTPQRWILRSGVIETEYGTILLAIGVFLGVLATGYIPVLLQMYATDVYHFGTTENGYLISLNSFVRGLFLTLAFPRLIFYGRRWLSWRSSAKDTEAFTPQSSAIPELPSQPNEFAAVEAIDEEEPVDPPKLSNQKETFAFDLLYTRYSLLADAMLTGTATFISQGWQMYLIAVLLPFASGTGAAAKGTILQMCSPDERTDALSAITLIEMVARLTTSKFM
jgi:MFS family permease